MISEQKIPCELFPTWLKTKLEENQMELDLQQNQNNFTIPFEKFDDSQKEVVFKVMMTLKKWLEKSSDFVPLRMTIRGIPGSGKSTVIKFLRRTMHQILDNVPAH